LQAEIPRDEGEKHREKKYPSLPEPAFFELTVYFEDLPDQGAIRRSEINGSVYPLH
jgi:hypothetical protein